MKMALPNRISDGITPQELRRLQRDWGLTDATIASHLHLSRSSYTNKKRGFRPFTPAELIRLRTFTSQLSAAPVTAPAIQSAPPQDAA